VAAGWLLIASCGDDPPAPSRTPAEIVLYGSGQHGTAGLALPSTLVAEVRDGSGEPLSDIPVVFTVTTGGGATSDTIAVTGAAGRAVVDWFLGPDPDAVQTLTVAADALSATFTATAEYPVAGTTHFGRSQYIEYLAGDLPIIVSAPHGGIVVPAEIADRTTGTTVRDTNTEELARAIATALFTLTGRRPHLIICRLSRRKLDANREIVEAAQGNRFAERAWFEYHSFIESARRSVLREYGVGFYIDLHGHGHPIARVELGYLLTSAELGLSDGAIDQSAYENRTSIRTLSQRSPASFVEILRGPTSLGGLLQAHAIPAVPSLAHPDPDADPYFSGGYNTARHGSLDGGEISGVQIETHFPGLRDTGGNRATFALALAAALATYLEDHAGLVIGAAAR
jgi:hypothetical protein